MVYWLGYDPNILYSLSSLKNKTALPYPMHPVKSPSLATATA